MLRVKRTPVNAGEKETLRALLDNYRAIMLWKLEGVGSDEAVRPLVPSGTSLLGLVKHLAVTELWWFCDAIGGEDVEYPWKDADDFRITEYEDVASLSAFYEECVGRANDVIDRHDLDYVGRGHGRQVSLRWAMMHMLEETARHAGHADILRELTDGRTGHSP